MCINADRHVVAVIVLGMQAVLIIFANVKNFRPLYTVNHEVQAQFAVDHATSSCELESLATLPAGYSTSYVYVPEEVTDRIPDNPCANSQVGREMSRRFQTYLDGLPEMDFNKTTAPGTLAAIKANAPFGEFLKMYIVESRVALAKGRRLAVPKDEFLKGYQWLQVPGVQGTYARWNATLKTRSKELSATKLMASSELSMPAKFDVDMWMVGQLAHRTLQLAPSLEEEARKLMSRVRWPVGKTLIGLHVRRGDACTCNKNETVCNGKPQGGGRCCPTLRKYVKGVSLLSRALNTRYVVLATDGLPGRIASFIRTVDPSLIVLTIPRVGWWDPWTLYKSPKAYSQIIENVVSRLSRPKRVRDVSKQSILELYLLSKCQAFVGAAFSNFFRVAFWASYGRNGKLPPFYNVDYPWCLHPKCTATTDDVEHCLDSDFPKDKCAASQMTCVDDVKLSMAG